MPYKILPDEMEKTESVIENALEYIKENNAPLALIIRKNTFEPYKLKDVENTAFEMNRENALKTIVELLGENDIVVSTTGKTSRELFEYREELRQGHEKDFLTVGSMGHANQIALGIAIQKPKFQVYCFDGDGTLLMHAGSMGIIGDLSPKNFKHILFNNGSHDSVGGQPSVGFKTNFPNIAEAFNYKFVAKVDNSPDLKRIFNKFKLSEGPAFLEICINKGARKGLGRPTSTPLENKKLFMDYLKK